MRLGNHREARALLAAAVGYLEKTGSFTLAIRARKRIAKAHLIAWRPDKAVNELCIAYEIAQQHHVYGQITPLMETIHDWSCRFGLRRKK